MYDEQFTSCYSLKPATNYYIDGKPFREYIYGTGPEEKFILSNPSDILKQKIRKILASCFLLSSEEAATQLEIRVRDLRRCYRLIGLPSWPSQRGRPVKNSLAYKVRNFFLWPLKNNAPSLKIEKESTSINQKSSKQPISQPSSLPRSTQGLSALSKVALTNILNSKHVNQLLICKKDRKTLNEAFAKRDNKINADIFFRT